MIRIITLIVFFVCNTLCAQSQYEAGMQKALTLLSENKTTEASALFEKAAGEEKNNWLPQYYIVLVATNEALNTKDKERLTYLLSKAQTAQDNAMALAPDNAELLVMQARIYTAMIVADPMANGMKFSPKVKELYARAQALAPGNPRVVLCKAEFEMGYARFFGNDTSLMCKEVQRAVGLFANFKPETPFSPMWGKDKADKALKECNQ